MIKILKKAIEHFGEPSQIKKCIEELAELIVGISKNDRDSIIEEIADVEIMINQLKMIYKIKPSEINKIKRYKIKRLSEIMK